MNAKRKIIRNQEKKKLQEIRNTYGKKPKGICPNCRKHSLFMVNNKGEYFCIRCDKRVK